MSQRPSHSRGLFALTFGVGLAIGVAAVAITKRNAQSASSDSQRAAAVERPAPAAERVQAAGPSAPPAARQEPVADTPAQAAPMATGEMPDWKGQLFPGLMSARQGANESAAIATLRSLAAAQAMLQAMGSVDTDGDGAGEYGYFGELSGGVPLRAFGKTEPRFLEPAVLAPSFRELKADADGAGVVERSGYLYKVFLPGLEVKGFVPGVAEAAKGGVPLGHANSRKWASNECEYLWCAYAWPVSSDKGSRVFFVNQSGDLLQFADADGQYRGLDNPPPCSAAFSTDREGGMNSSLGAKDYGSEATDGNLWQLIGG